MRSVAAVILAAGMGTRMRSDLVKVLHPLSGRPMLEHVIDAVRLAAVDRAIVVVGHQADRVRQTIKGPVEFVLQEEQLGTGHAVMQAEASLKDFEGLVLVTYGDTPLYTSKTYQWFIDCHRRSGAKATVLSTIVGDPRGYGRVLRREDGSFAEIVEQKDIDSPDVESVREINTGTYCFDARALFEFLKNLSNDNRQGEYYLTDVLKALRASDEPVDIVVLPDETEALGINDRIQLAQAEQVLRRRALASLMESGVTIVDPDATYIHSSVTIGKDTVIYPFTSIEGETSIGEGCRIGPNVRIVDSKLGDSVTIDASSVYQSTVHDRAEIGPYIFVPPGSEVREGKRIDRQW